MVRHEICASDITSIIFYIWMLQMLYKKVNIACTSIDQ